MVLDNDLLDFQYAGIGRRFGISKEPVRQILKGNPRPQKPDLLPEAILTTITTQQVVSLLVAGH